jgi:hypothetical protein
VTQILADAAMAKQLEEATGPVPVVDEKGTVIAVCTPIKFPHSPYSREEVEAARKQCREHPEECRSLAEFWEEMEKRHGSLS